MSEQAQFMDKRDIAASGCIPPTATQELASKIETLLANLADPGTNDSPALETLEHTEGSRVWGLTYKGVPFSIVMNVTP